MDLQVMQNVLDWGYDKAVNGVPGLDSAKELADDYLNEDGSLSEKVDSLIRWQNTRCATSGFITNLGGLITLPVAIPANVSSTLYVQLRMIAAIAYMGGYDLKDDKVRALVYLCLCGNEAKEMLGRTPEQIKAVRPLKDGVIADFTATQLMLKNLIEKVGKRYNVGKPRVVVGVPSGITEVEERAVEESVIQAGAKEVYLIEEPMAAAIGAALDVGEPSGSIIVDIGGGTTEVAVISLGGIVVSHSLRVAGDELDEDIVNYVKKEENLAIGETTAEQIKMQIGCAMPLMTEMSMEVRGRDLADGLPRTIKVTSTQIEEAMKESIGKIVEIVKLTLEKTPPELASDIMEKGIVLAGGGALIKNLDKLLSLETGMPVYVAEEPLDCVVRGTGKTLEDLERLKTVLINARKRK